MAPTFRVQSIKAGFVLLPQAITSTAHLCRRAASSTVRKPRPWRQPVPSLVARTRTPPGGCASSRTSGPGASRRSPAQSRQPPALPAKDFRVALEPADHRIWDVGVCDGELPEVGPPGAEQTGDVRGVEPDGETGFAVADRRVREPVPDIGQVDEGVNRGIGVRAGHGTPDRRAHRRAGGGHRPGS